MIISVDANNFDKIQHLFMIKILNKLDIEGMYLNIIKATRDKSSDSITLRGENLKAILEDRDKIKMPTLAASIQHCLAKATGQEK